MSKQPNLPGTAPVKKKQYTEYPGRRCPHAAAHPLPHIKYQVEKLPGFRTVLQQTGLSVASTGHSAARRILGAHVKHGTDYAVFVDENGYGGFVPKPGTIPEGARLTNPNICQWALPKPVPTAVVHGVVHGNGSTFPPIITDLPISATSAPFPPTSTGVNQPDATPEQRQRAASALQTVINASTGCYPEGLDDYILAGQTGLPVDLISEVRVYLFGHPKPPLDPAELLTLKGEVAVLAEMVSDYRSRVEAALLKLGV